MAKDAKKTSGTSRSGKGAKGATASSAKGKADRTTGKVGKRPAAKTASSKNAKPVKNAKPTKTAKSAKPVKAAKTPAPEIVVVTKPTGLPLDFTSALKVGAGFDLADLSPRATPGFDGDKKAGEELLASMAEEVGDLQERLYAEASGGGKRRLLLVVQGMDTSGKGGIMRHVVGAMDPQGVDLTSFKAPTPEEQSHPFLWRIRNALPAAGQIGVFDRSHYEDVLIVRVRDLVPRSQWARRYAQINAFEKRLSAQGTTVIKVMLHVSKEEQKERLTERLDRPEKHWKFNPGDIDERLLWDDYQQAYQAALEKCSTEFAPWFVVPADRKWYARLAVQSLVREHLAVMDPQWPVADFDVEEQKARLAES